MADKYLHQLTDAVDPPDDTDLLFVEQNVGVAQPVGQVAAKWTFARLKAFINSNVPGRYNLRGNYDASGNVFPSAGGSGAAGAIEKANVWIISVAGTLGGKAVALGDEVIALVDAPGQTAGNWTIVEHDLGYVPAPLDSPALTGTPTAPTAAQGTSTTQLATTAMVQSEVTLLAPKASPALTGTPTAPTAAVATNTTQLATTAFVLANAVLKATAVKTASYAAAPLDLVPLDTTSGTPIVVTLPTAPADGTAIAVKWVLGANATATIVTGGSDVFNVAAGLTSFPLLVLNQQLQFRYKATGAIWYVEQNLPLIGTDARYGAVGAWTAPTLQNSWVAAGGVYQAPRYRTQGTDVNIEGAVSTGTSGTVAFTLPVGARPAASQYFTIITVGGVGYVLIGSNGTVTVGALTGNASTGLYFGRITFSTL